MCAIIRVKNTAFNADYVTFISLVVEIFAKMFDLHLSSLPKRYRLLSYD